VVGNVPDGNDRDTQFGIRSRVTPFDTVERIVRRERGEDTIGVVEGILEILDQLGFGFRPIVPALFAVFGRLLALKFVEEGELSAGGVLHLFAEAADAVELADCEDLGILVFRHGVSDADKIPSSANWSVPATLSAMDLGMSSGFAVGVDAEICGVADFPTAERARPHMIRRGRHEKGSSQPPIFGKRILEPQREVECAGS
jgi:hypothetical protein